MITNKYTSMELSFADILGISCFVGMFEVVSLTECVERLSTSDTMDVLGLPP